MPQAGFEDAQNVSSGFVKWICVAAITTTPKKFLQLFVLQISFEMSRLDNYCYRL